MGSSTAHRHRPAALALVLAALLAAPPAAPVQAAQPVPHVDLVAVGDSYTAGTGSGGWSWTFPCIQTPRGYVDDLNADPVVELDGNAACHGALLDSAAQPGNVPSVMDQVNRLTASGTLSGATELVTLTAGANDVDVNVALYACSTGTTLDCMAAVRTSTHELYNLEPALIQAYAAIHRAAPRAVIAVLGYPLLFDPAGGYPVVSPDNQKLVNYGTTALNQAISDASAAANAQFRANTRFIDVTARFSGHAANSPEPWIYFSTTPIAGIDGSPTPDPRNFHPNAAGHQQYAGAVEAAIQLTGLARR